jgi:Carboxypeptidase regulatory-like domain
MTRARFSFLLLAAWLLLFSMENVCAAQDSAVEPLTFPPANLPANAEETTLKVRLRLEDESPFLGAANVSLLPDDGYEIIGTPTGTDGETQFSGMPPGKYIVETSAPGYLTVRRSMQIEAGHRQRILYVVMKPRPVAQGAEKKQAETTTAATLPAGGNTFVAAAKPAVNGARDFWMVHELEQNVPPVDASVKCPTQQVLKGIGARMTEFVSNLEKFTATEELEHHRMDAKGEPEKRHFDYVVTVSPNDWGTFTLSEFRNGSTDMAQFPAGVATLGLPALALLFHPVLAQDFQFTCEGLGQSDGKAVWQVHFAQRTDRPVRIRSYRVGMRSFSVYLEGRVWVDPGSYQVERLEAELEKPITEIELANEHTIIKYLPIEFRSQKLQIWLPQEAATYVVRKGHRYYRRLVYTDFRLFNVDTAQNIEAPKGSYSFFNMSDDEITGVLTVVPREGTQVEAVSLRIVVPSRRRVYKVVGPGKDVNLPSSAVESATFVHNGRAESIRVEADLAHATTLDVISDTEAKKMP